VPPGVFPVQGEGARKFAGRLTFKPLKNILWVSILGKKNIIFGINIRYI
jgi:hypothetical protein